MSAFPKPEPQQIRIHQLPTNPDIKKLVVAYLVYGNDITRLARHLQIPEKIIAEKLESSEVKILISRLTQNPEDIIPSKAEIYAHLILEMKNGDRSTDRQRAIELLLQILGQERPNNSLDKYRIRND